MLVVVIDLRETEDDADIDDRIVLGVDKVGLNTILAQNGQHER